MNNSGDFYDGQRIEYVRTYDYYGWGCIICRWTYNRISGSYSYYQSYQPYQCYPLYSYQYYQPYSYHRQHKCTWNQNSTWQQFDNDHVNTYSYDLSISSGQEFSDHMQSENVKKICECDDKSKQSKITKNEKFDNISSPPVLTNQEEHKSEQNNQTNIDLNIKSNEFNNQPSRPLSQEDKFRADIAKQNEDIVSSGQYPIQTSELITLQMHDQICSELGEPTHTETRVFVNNLSTIKAVFNSHKHGQNDKICILNFADPYKPGGGYLNGRGAQEETVCRQTLLYPTIKNSQMYELNKEDRKPENSDIMQYSADVYVIRDDDYKLIENPFPINIISSSAVDNRSDVPEANEIMENRIRKIIRLAAFKKNDVLILGTFGCGVFKNDTYQICQIFKKILIEEGMKDYFKNVIFPILTMGNTFKLYKSAFSPK